MASQVEVPPLTGLIYGLFRSLRVNRQYNGQVLSRVKAPYSSKIDIFYPKRFNKLIYSIDKIINVAPDTL